MNKLFKVIFLWAIVCSAQANNELIQLLSNMRTLQASFQQFVVDKTGAPSGPKTLGTVFLERPGKLRWEITQPNKQLILITANKFLLYDVDLAQVTRREITKDNYNNPALLLYSKPQVLEQLFVIREQRTKNGIWFELFPKKRTENMSGYRSFKFHFVAGQLKAIDILDNLGQCSKIYFTNIVLNARVASSKFIFTVPPKVDILDG